MMQPAIKGGEGWGNGQKGFRGSGTLLDGRVRRDSVSEVKSGSYSGTITTIYDPLSRLSSRTRSDPSPPIACVAEAEGQTKTARSSRRM
jgi:hypothetical protein